VTLGKKGSGYGLKYNRDGVAVAVRDLPIRHRSAIWLLGGQGALAICSKSTMHCLITTEKKLTEENKLEVGVLSQ
jgi:hypothetical protein